MRQRYHPARPGGTIFNHLTRKPEETALHADKLRGGVGLSETDVLVVNTAPRRQAARWRIAKVDGTGLIRPASNQADKGIHFFTASQHSVPVFPLRPHALIAWLSASSNKRYGQNLNLELSLA